jgi:hypothetical protein
MSVASSSPRGLTEIEAQRRLKAEGYNELPRADRRTPLRIVLEVLREPMLALLLGGGTIYLALGGSSHSANCRWPRRLQRSLKCEARCRRHMLFAPPGPRFTDLGAALGDRSSVESTTRPNADTTTQANSFHAFSVTRGTLPPRH